MKNPSLIKSVETKEDLGKLDLTQFIDGVDEFNIRWALNRKMKAEKISYPDFDNIKKKYGPLTGKLGLDLEIALVPTYGGAHKEKSRNYYLIYNIIDGPKFISYLESLEKNKATADQINALKRLILALDIQVAGIYDLDKVDDRLIEALSVLDRIIKTSERLDPNHMKGLANATKPLEGYLQAMQQEDLKAFIMTKRKKYN